MPNPRPGGRPSLLESEQIKARILSRAREMFFAFGYGPASIEKIAQACGISKRTFYHRFENKAALFAEVVHDILGGLHVGDYEHLFAGKPFDVLLLTLARTMLEAALRPETLALHRIIIAESLQFPELAAAVEKEGAKSQAISRITALFENAMRQGTITLRDSKLAAEVYFQTVLSAPQRRAMLGNPMTPAELEDWTRESVYLFLNGCLRAR